MENSLFSIHERIKYLRENLLDINQNEMSIRIGIKQGSLSDIERKRTKTVTDRVIKDICREFNVSEDWLRTGEGEMFIENDSTIVSKLSTEYNLDSIDVEIVKGYLELDPEQRKAIKNYISSVSNAIAHQEIAVAKDEENDIDKELESYRLELEAEKRGRILSVSGDTEKNIS